MITIRKNQDRGRSRNDWLDSFHTFSFADYYDPKFLGFGALRVINEDTVQPGLGFGRHPHDNMEIISYVVEGSLEHKDSMGNGSIIRPGEIQIMTAGTGVKHGEFNHSKTELLHFLQIWIIPERQQLEPRYEQKKIVREKNKLILIGSHDGNTNAVIIHQDTKLFVAYLDRDHSITHKFAKDRKAWLQLINGKVVLNNQLLSSGDGAAIVDENEIFINCNENAEFLLFDLATNSSVLC